MIKTLLRHIGQYRTAAILTPIFIMLEVVMDVLIPYVTSWLIDDGINARHLPNVYRYGGLMLLMAFVSLAMGILGGRFVAKASTGFAANLRKAMYRNIQRFAFSDIDKYSTSGLVTRMTTDVTNLQNAFQMILRTSIRAPFSLIFSIVMCFVISPRMSLIFVTATVILAVILTVIIKRVSATFTRVFKQYDVLNSAVQENVSAIRVVKAFVREDYENQKFELAARGLYNLYVKAERLMAVNHPVMNMVVYGCIIAISWFGAQFVVDGQLTTGQITSLFTYVMSILMSLMMLSMIFVQITMSAASGKRVVEVINEVPDIVNPEQPDAEIPDGRIDFNHVSFAYKGGSGEYALHDIDLHIQSGETIGVIGGTGSGKSSLINLISRLYDTTRGSVAVGGKDVRTLDLTTLRNCVSVVLQKNVLFSGSILDNLRWGNPDATLQQCQQACRIACADEFIQQMPDGYNTHIEQGGTNVSGGQRQRLCIARALLKQPLVLILDDSTSACDNATDARIREALRRDVPAMTRIIIAQRISSLKDCDRILVLDGGRVNGWGTHENLLKNNKIYQEICAIQDEDGGDFDEPNGRKEDAR
ncbi:MAG: ABC transporter ATP-binding protein [Muribaculaceae bacterium]|nr:ABC transporter ATP-binding protein [Muribaculaceae bacterium]